MDITQFTELKSKTPKIANEMYGLMKELYPICRSITGDGVRSTLKIINRYVDLEIKEVPSGTKVFDWIIPKEWNIKDAYVIDPQGNKIIDFKKSNLHVVNYSVPIHKKMSLDDLRPHLHTLQEQPDVIPYRTSYYEENWGFCLTHNQLMTLQEGEYEVCVDSTLTNGFLTYGEYHIKGQSDNEILISCYVCHPSMCNDNLSGVVLTTLLAKNLKNLNLDYSYRFLFIPETIGAITWLSFNQQHLQKIKHGLVATCLGDSGNSTYKKTRSGDAEIDRVVTHVLKYSYSQHTILDFYPTGSDERQFCSPGFNLPIGSLMRSPYGRYPEYHTSADNFDIVKTEYLEDTLKKYLSVISILEWNKKYINQNPKCEPQLSKYGLLSNIGGHDRGSIIKDNVISWVLNFSDGKHSLLEIAEKSGVEFEIVKKTAELLSKHKLLNKCN